MKLLSKIILSFSLCLVMQNTYSFVGAKVLKDAFKAALQVKPNIEKIGGLHGEKIAEMAQKARDYNHSWIEAYGQTKELFQAVRVAMEQNPGKTFLGGMFLGSGLSGGYFSHLDNPYEQQLKETIFEAAKHNDANLVKALVAIDYDQETVKKAILQNVSFDNKDQILTQKDQILRQKEMLKLVLLNNREIFKFLLEKLDNPQEIIESVVKHGDIEKVESLLQMQVAPKKILHYAIKVKNVEITAKLLQLQEPHLSVDEAVIKAKFLCDRTLFQRLFYQHFLDRFHKFFKNRQTSVDEPISQQA